jgi:hypothetical protein
MMTQRTLLMLMDWRPVCDIKFSRRTTNIPTLATGQARVGTASFLIFLPIIYGVVGFIGGVIAALIYNLVAKGIGGIEFTTEEVS